MAGVATPPIIVEGFGINAASGTITNPIPVPSQQQSNPGRASYNDGFVTLNMTPIASGGVPPFEQDMNGILFAATQNIAAFTGGQYWTFNTAFVTNNGGYAPGAIIPMAAGNGWWINTSGVVNANNPDTSAAASSGWTPLACVGTSSISGLASGTVTLTATQAAPPILILTGTLTANTTLVLPPWGRRWDVLNLTTGSYEIIIASTGSGSAVIPTGGIASVIVTTSGVVYSGLVAASVGT